MATTTNKPTDQIRLGIIQAAIWRNEDSEGRPRFQVTLERLYRDEEGNWKSSGSFGRDELLTLAKVADLAHTRIHGLQTEAREAAKDEQKPAATTTAKRAGRSR